MCYVPKRHFIFLVNSFYNVARKERVMKNKLLLLFGTLLLSNLLYVLNVSAKDNNFYQNENGVIMNKNEYDYFSKIYWDGYQSYVTQEEYDNIKNMNLFDKDVMKREIVQEEYVESPITRGSSVTSNLRTLSIGKSCSNDCLITLVTSWDGGTIYKKL